MRTVQRDHVVIGGRGRLPRTFSLAPPNERYIPAKTGRYSFAFRSESRFAVISSARMTPGVPASMATVRLRMTAARTIATLYYNASRNDDPASKHPLR
jgi:hypothetical protein